MAYDPSAAAFLDTTRALNADRGRWRLVALGLALVFFAAWGVWFTQGELTEWAVSESGRVEVERSAHPVDAPVAGRIVVSRLVLGAEIRAGDVVVEIDDEQERRRLAEARARLGAINPVIAALQRTLSAQEVVASLEQGVTTKAGQEGDARRREAEAASGLAAEEAKRAARLFDGGSIPELEFLRARTEAERRRVATDAVGFGTERQHGELRARERRDVVEIEQLRKDIADLEGRRAITTAEIDLLTFEIERRHIVAAVDGRVADTSSFRVGAHVREGEHLGSILPSGKTKVVAAFAPATALGRVRHGQPARARVDAFPWVEFGTVPLEVLAVGNEPRDGKARVELTVVPNASTRIVLEHGLVCNVEVAVGKTTPARLLLRAVGHWAEPATTHAPALDGGVP